MQLKMERMGTNALMVTLDKVQPHWFSLKPRVVLVSPSARMLRQYLYRTEILDLAHVHEVQIQNNIVNILPEWALIYCRATSILVTQRSVKHQGISHGVVYVTTLGLN